MPLEAYRHRSRSESVSALLKYSASVQELAPTKDEGESLIVWLAPSDSARFTQRHSVDRLMSMIARLSVFPYATRSETLSALDGQAQLEVSRSCRAGPCVSAGRGAATVDHWRQHTSIMRRGAN